MMMRMPTVPPLLLYLRVLYSSSLAAKLPCSIFIGFNLNLPLDEFGAGDFNYIQNLVGNHAYYSDYVL
jgi:hypothetical protein